MRFPSTEDKHPSFPSSIKIRNSVRVPQTGFHDFNLRLQHPPKIYILIETPLQNLWKEKRSRGGRGSISGKHVSVFLKAVHSVGE